MIVFYYSKYIITEIVSTEKGSFSDYVNRGIVAGLLDFADRFKNEILVWCDESEKGNLNSG